MAESKKTFYKDIKAIQKKLWENDDCVSQETLFDVQEMVCKLALEIAKSEGKTADLIKTFPCLYRRV